MAIPVFTLIRTFITVLACVSLSAGIAWGQAKTPATVVIATGLDPSFAHYVVSVKKGFFEKQGIRAELKAHDDGNVALDALLTGNADIGGTSELGGLARIGRGGKLFVVGSGIQSDDFFGVVGKNSIQVPKDFEGKTIGVARASGGHYFLAKYARRHGLDLNRMTIKYLQAPESVAALSRGDVDAFFFWEPWLSRGAAAVPNTRVIARSGGILRLNTYIYFSQRLIDNEALAKRSVRAIIDGATWIPGHWDEAAKIVGDTYRLKADDASRMMKIVGWRIHYSMDFRNNFVDAAEFAKSVGIINEIPNLDHFLRPEVLRAVAPDRVE